MRPLIAVRLYTGLVDSMASGIWRPQGVPAFYRLLEHLSGQNTAAEVLLFAKTPEESRPFGDTLRRRFPDLLHDFTVVPYSRCLPRHPSLAARTNEAFQLAYFARRLWASGHDLVYTDRANAKAAALAAAWGRPAVLRLLGVAGLPQSMRSCRQRLLNLGNHLAMGRKLGLVICTEDGSPSRAYLRQRLHPETPAVIVPNGVDACPTLIPASTLRVNLGLAPGLPVVLFVGRPTPDKGFTDFLDAMALSAQRGLPCQGVAVVGTADPSWARTQADARGLGRCLSVLGFVPHADMASLYGMAHVYVSLNRFGNMSNTVLEALSLGVCTCLLESAEDGTDEATSRLVPPDAALRVPRTNTATGLACLLSDLLNDPTRIAATGQAAAGFAKEYLRPWDERLAWETSLLERLSRGETLGFSGVRDDWRALVTDPLGMHSPAGFQQAPGTPGSTRAGTPQTRRGPPPRGGSGL